MSIFFGLLFARRFYCRSALSPGRTGGLFPHINAPKRASLEVSEALKVLIYKAYYASNKVLTLASGSYFIASSTATAVATVAPTIGLLPIPIRPIIST